MRFTTYYSIFHHIRTYYITLNYIILHYITTLHYYIGLRHCITTLYCYNTLYTALYHHIILHCTFLPCVILDDFLQLYCMYIEIIWNNIEIILPFHYIVLIPSHSIAFYRILLHSIILYHTLLHSITFYYILLHSITFCYILLHSANTRQVCMWARSKPLWHSIILIG